MKILDTQSSVRRLDMAQEKRLIGGRSRASVKKIMAGNGSRGLCRMTITWDWQGHFLEVDCGVADSLRQSEVASPSDLPKATLLRRMLRCSDLKETEEICSLGMVAIARRCKNQQLLAVSTRNNAGFGF